MMTIWKFPLQLTDRQTILVPSGTRQTLLVATQDEVITLWIEVDPQAPLMSLMVVIVGTGRPVPDDAIAHLGSVMTAGGMFVWHVYEVAVP